MTTADQAASSTMRRLPIWGFVVLVIVWMAAIQGFTRLAQPADAGYADFQTISDVTRSLWVTVGVGSLIVLAAIAYLRWWRPVIVEDPQLRLPRWAWVFPVILLVTILVGTNYSRLFDRGIGFVLAFVIGAVFIGVSEEGMFRGIGIVTFRNASLAEGWVAFWTCLMFGSVHFFNIFTEGAGAIPQVVVTACAGYFFYLVRRVSGGIILCILLHGFWDMGLFSNTLDKDALGIGYGSFIFILVDIILVILALATFRKIWPKKVARDGVGVGSVEHHGDRAIVQKTMVTTWH